MVQETKMYTAYDAAKQFDIPHSTIKDDINRYNKFQKYIDSGKVIKSEGKWLIPENVILEVYRERFATKEMEEAKQFEATIKEVTKDINLSTDSLTTLYYANEDETLKIRVIIPFLVDAYFEDYTSRAYDPFDIFSTVYKPIVKGRTTKYANESEIAMNNLILIDRLATNINGKKIEMNKKLLNSFVEMIEDFVLTLESIWDTHNELRRIAIPKLEEYRESFSGTLPNSKLGLLDLVIEKSKQESVAKLEYDTTQGEVQFLTLPKLTGMKNKDMYTLLKDSYHLFSPQDQKKLVTNAYKKFDSSIFKGTQVDENYQFIAENEIAVKALRAKKLSGIDFTKINLNEADKEDATLILSYVNDFTNKASTERLDKLNETLGTDYTSAEMFKVIDLLNKAFLKTASDEEILELTSLLGDLVHFKNEIEYDDFSEFFNQKVMLNKIESLICLALNVIPYKHSYEETTKYGFFVEDKKINFEKTLDNLVSNFKYLISYEMTALDWYVHLSETDKENNIFNQIDSKKYLKWTNSFISLNNTPYSLQEAFAAYWSDREQNEILRYGLLELTKERILSPVEEYDYNNAEKVLSATFGDEVVKRYKVEVVANDILNSDIPLIKKLECVTDDITYLESNYVFKVLEKEEPELLANAFFLISGKKYADMKSAIDERYEELKKNTLSRILKFVIALLMNRNGVRTVYSRF